MNLNHHGHSFNIQWDISILLKGIENCKSQVVATLGDPAVLQQVLVVHACLPCWFDWEGCQVGSPEAEITPLDQ